MAGPGLAALALAACAGGASRTDVAVRVGSATVSRGAVEHWSAMVARESAERGESQSRLALHTLIVMQWIIREAAQRGLAISNREVERRMSSGGRGAVADATKWSGRRLGDLKLEATAELAAQGLREYVERQERAASHVPFAQVLRYWRNSPQFVHRERRTLNFIESLPSLSAGRRLKREIREGKRSLASVSIRETREPWRDPPAPGEANGIIHTAIFHAPLRVLEGPLPWNGVYAMFEVIHVAPPSRRPLSQVRSSIEVKLAGEARRRVRAAFVAAWRARWHELTDCRPGFVIGLCRQYRGHISNALEPFAVPAAGG